MKRAAGLTLLFVLAFGGAGPLRFRMPGRDAATLMFISWVYPIEADLMVEAGRRYRVRRVLVREWSMWQERVRLEPYDLPVSGPQSASGTGMTESRPMRTSAKS